MQKITYAEDGLSTIHNCDFIKDPRFIYAFNRGMQAHGISLDVRWRIHIALWIADTVKNLEGDFVECGVNTGILSSSIMEYINWNFLNKQFFLFDTFNGVDIKYLNDHEKAILDDKLYSECYERAKDNFKEFKHVHLIKGTVPDTLNSINIDKVCYLSLDMNCTFPEISAAEFFWPKMSRGAIALLDDYGYPGYESQKIAFDKFAHQKNITILYLPTGQGIYVKP